MQKEQKASVIIMCTSVTDKLLAVCTVYNCTCTCISIGTNANESSLFGKLASLLASQDKF